MSAGAWVAFLVAAGIGAPARYLLDGWVQDGTSGTLPWGTFVVNVSGCLAVGVVVGLSLHHDLGETTRVIIGSGGLGTYTTFSTFTFETVRLAEHGALGSALGNAAAHLLAGFVAASIGLAGIAALP